MPSSTDAARGASVLSFEGISNRALQQHMNSRYMRWAWFSLAFAGAVSTFLSALVSIAISFDVYALGKYAQRFGGTPVAAGEPGLIRESRLGVAAALQLNPLDASFWFHRYLFLGDAACRQSARVCETAVESLKYAIHQRPYWTSAWSALAVALVERGDEPTEAIWALDRAVRFGPHEIVVREAVVTVGLIYPKELLRARRAMFENAVVAMLETDGESLVNIAAQLGRTKWLAEYLAVVGRREQFEALWAKYRVEQAAAPGR